MKQTQDELQFLDKLSKFKNILIFSPHFDDAILSIGSLLNTLVKLKKNIKVVNIFTKGSSLNSPLTEKLLKQAEITNPTNYFLARRNEDQKAFKKLGQINIEKLGFIDAAWRVGKDNLALYPKTALRDIHQDDRQLIKLVVSRIKNFSDSGTVIFAPLARGRHVDHQIVRNVVTEIFNQVIYYNDFPYSEKYENEDQFIKDHKLSFIDWQEDYQKKRDLVLMYKTQLTSLLQGKDLKLLFERFYVNEF